MPKNKPEPGACLSSDLTRSLTILRSLHAELLRSYPKLNDPEPAACLYLPILPDAQLRNRSHAKFLRSYPGTISTRGYRS